MIVFVKPILIGRLFQTDTMRLIYAISPDGTDTLRYHSTSRGSRSLYLRKRIVSNHTIPDDAFTIDVKVHDVSDSGQKIAHRP